MDERTTVGLQATQAQEGQGVQAVPPRTPAMAEQGVSDHRGSLRCDPLPSRGGSNRRLRLWLGSGMATQNGEGAVEQTAEAGAYKCAGTSHHIPGAQAFLGLPEGPEYPRPIRQHLGRLPCKPPGGYQIRPVSVGGTAAPPKALPLAVIWNS